MPSCRELSRHSNQALGLAEYAIDFCYGRCADIDSSVVQRLELFHLDSVVCGVSALAHRTNAPTLLRTEALEYRLPRELGARGARCFGSAVDVWPEKGIVANCAAVREWDANGTNFGFNPEQGAVRGEFGHNDFYPVAVAAAQVAGHDGATLLRAMLCLDEIRGRLAEVFALRSYAIDHVLHGAIASAAVYGALRGATAPQIESAIGMVVAHYVPYRAIRAGEQLSDSKGSSAAISAEVAALAAERSLRGFQGPADIFRNPQALFLLNERAENRSSPFDLTLATSGDNFAIQQMHFKLGLYEHQSASAIHGLIELLRAYPAILEDPQSIERLRIVIYEPAFSIIGDPAKRDPRTRQSADHSMLYIIGTLLKKACQNQSRDWKDLMLLPSDYDETSLHDPLTRSFMDRIDFQHGGPDYDRQYPAGIPTSVELHHRKLGSLSSGLVLYPKGHAANRDTDLEGLLQWKWQRLLEGAVEDPTALVDSLRNLSQKTPQQLRHLYEFPIRNV